MLPCIVNQSLELTHAAQSQGSCGVERQDVLNYMWNKCISLRRRAAVFWGGNRKGGSVWELRALRQQESSGKR